MLWRSCMCWLVLMEEALSERTIKRLSARKPVEHLSSCLIAYLNPHILIFRVVEAYEIGLNGGGQTFPNSARGTVDGVRTYCKATSSP